MAIFQIGPAPIIDPEIGETSLSIAADSFFAIMVAGTLVAFITEFGFLEFLGKLLEPIMRRVYKVPGKSAVDAISSFVAAPAAGVMITNDCIRRSIYSQRSQLHHHQLQYCQSGRFCLPVIHCRNRKISTARLYWRLLSVYLYWRQL